MMARGDNRDARLAPRLAARAAWQRGAHARHVPWRGAIYWPHVYADEFYYTFWPQAYEPGYWAYVYDDFFDGVFFPDGAPYVEYAEGPYEDRTRGRPPGLRRAAKFLSGGDAGSAPSSRRAGQGHHRLAARPDRRGGQAEPEQKDCWRSWSRLPISRRPAQTGLPRGSADDAGRPAGGDDHAAAGDARRREAGSPAARKVLCIAERRAEGALQRDRSGHRAHRPGQGGVTADAQQADCGGAKSGLSGLAIDRIEDVVRPTEAQLKALDRLSDHWTRRS